MPIMLQVGSQLLVMLDDGNLQRIAVRDPLAINITRLESDSRRAVTHVVVTYANAGDVAEVHRLCRAGQPRAAFEFACRGMTTQAEDKIGTVVIDSSKREPGGGS